MSYTLRILRRAAEDANEIFQWIAERSPEGAERWLAAFESASERLLVNPFAWPTAPENELVDYEVRHVLFETRRGRKYRALYTVIDDEVGILHVRGGAQNTLIALGSPDDD